MLSFAKRLLTQRDSAYAPAEQTCEGRADGVLTEAAALVLYRPGAPASLPSRRTVFSGTRGSRSRSGSRHPTPTAGCRRRECPRHP